MNFLKVIFFLGAIVILCIILTDAELVGRLNIVNYSTKLSI